MKLERLLRKKTGKLNINKVISLWSRNFCVIMPIKGREFPILRVRHSFHGQESFQFKQISEHTATFLINQLGLTNIGITNPKSKLDRNLNSYYYKK